MATAYSGETITNYLSGVRAWHLLHGVPWALEKKEMDTMLQASKKLSPATSRKKRLPYTSTFISAVGQKLNLEQPLDMAVFTCITTCFYASARLGEVTVRTQTSFNPNKHITTRTYPMTRTGMTSRSRTCSRTMSSALAAHSQKTSSSRGSPKRHAQPASSRCKGMALGSGRPSNTFHEVSPSM